MNIHQSVIFPGEQVHFNESDETQLRIGRGLTYFCTLRTLRATQMGRLIQSGKKTFYIDYDCRKVCFKM